IEGAKGMIRRVAFQPRGQLLAAAEDGGFVRVWDVATGALVQSLQGAQHWMNSVAISADGRQVAISSMSTSTKVRQWSGEVRIWDVASGRAVQSITTQINGYFRGVAFSPDSSLVAAAFDEVDGERITSGAKLWDTRTWKLKRTLLRD